MKEKEKTDLFEKMYNELSDKLYRHCYFRVSSKEKAEDLVQETFFKFWRELDKNEIEYPKAWIYRTARNAIIDHYRKKKTNSLDTIMEGGFDPSEDKIHEDIEKNAEVSIILDKLQKLPDSDRELVVMRYVDDMEISEIADVMDSNNNAVTVRIHRAVQKLKEVINEK